MKMKVEITGGPVTLDGKPFVDEKGEPMSFKTIVANALLGNYQDEANLDGAEKLKRWQLARRIHEAEEIVELTAEEIALAKRLVAKGFVTVVSAQTWELLEAGAAATPLQALR
jgi:hypothetical protein